MNETEEHIALSELFQRHPELATWLAEVLGLELPRVTRRTPRTPPTR